MTEGFDVLVQLVMAAMTTAPWLERRPVCPRTSTATDFASVLRRPRPKPRSFTGATSALRNDSFIAVSATRSCGRFGPARLGSTVERSSSSVSVKTGSGVASVRKRPCSFV